MRREVLMAMHSTARGGQNEITATACVNIGEEKM